MIWPTLRQLPFRGDELYLNGNLCLTKINSLATHLCLKGNTEDISSIYEGQQLHGEAA